MAAKNTKASQKATSKPQAKQNANGKGKTASKAPKPQNASQPEDAYRQGGGYWSAVRALRELGLGKMHPLDKVLAAYKRAMGSKGWLEFSAVKPRNKKTGKDADGRALQNVAVVARKDYGQALREVGYEVRWDGREKQAGLFRTGRAR